MADKSKQQSIDLNTLSVDNLAAVKKQLDEELEQLSNAFTKLRSAQHKFKECITSVRKGVSETQAGKTILIPLTTSLYVPGTLASTSHVLVDVGTGYYVEKTTDDAVKFYEGKVKMLGENLGELEKQIQGRGQNVRVVEDVLRQKVVQQQQQQQQAQAQAAT